LNRRVWKQFIFKKKNIYICKMFCDCHRAHYVIIVLISGSIPDQSMWDLWWTKWHWDRFFFQYFGFPLSVSFHRCYITRKNEKKLIICHHSCTISLKTAVRP
jgi:hypothetical protein